MCVCGYVIWRDTERRKWMDGYTIHDVMNSVFCFYESLCFIEALC